MWSHHYVIHSIHTDIMLELFLFKVSIVKYIPVRSPWDLGRIPLLYLNSDIYDY